MKVLHLISGGDVGGAKTHVHSLLCQLNKSIQAHMICFTEGDFSHEAEALGIPTTIIDKGFFATITELTAFIKTGGYEILHCHGSKANMYGAILKNRLNVPVVTTVHSDYRLDYLGRPLHRLIYGTINTVSLRLLDYRIGVSDPIGDMLVSRGFDPHTTFAIYNGIDYSKNICPIPRDEFFSSLNFPVEPDSVVFGIAARLDPVKDMATLIKAFAKVCKSCPKARLVIAGDGPELNSLTELCRTLEISSAVCFAGWITDTDSFYSAIDVNLLTSLSETFPYVLTEGARMYLPTISSKVGGVPLLIDHGVNGFLFTPGNHDELAEYMIRLAESKELRVSFGQKLGQKARENYSIDVTYQRQLEIYETIIRRKHTGKNGRQGVLICGAYGKGNAGDDAILEAVVGEMRSIDRDMPIYVLSRTPKATCVKYRIRAVHTFNIPGFIKIMRHTKLYISGGGSLIQDVTSTRSLLYYLHSMRLAKGLGNKVQMYGCGIGPVKLEKNRRLAAKYINRYADCITVREPSSLTELKALGVTKPQILLAADPALTLSPAPASQIDSCLYSAGIDPEGSYILFALRPWPGFEEKADIIAKAAEYAYTEYGLTPLFFPVEPDRDIPAARLIMDRLSIPGKLLPCPSNGGLAVGLMSHMKAVVSMRLHALVFAAGASAPLVGIVYDPKVSSFLDYIGENNYVNLDGLTLETLTAMLDSAMDSPKSPEAAKKLLDIEFVNTSTAKKLLME